MPLSVRVIQVCLYLFAAIAIAGGVLQMSLGQPQSEPRLDNVHRFMAGIYLGTGLICGWAASTVMEQHTLVYLLAVGVFIAGVGRLISIARVGLPQPSALWLGYLIPELVLPVVMVVCQWARG